MPDSKPNILVIWGDDIGITNLSCYSDGLMGYRTPSIDRIADEGMRFTDSYGEQSCTAGRSSFITGQSVYRTPTRTPKRTPTGPVGVCQPKPSGRLRPAADLIERSSPGAMNPSRQVTGSPTSGMATSLGDLMLVTARPRRSNRSPPTRTACTTWPETFGTGLSTGIPIITRPRSTSRVAYRVIRGAAPSPTATTAGNPSSECRGK
jgi:hypothetical protein